MATSTLGSLAVYLTGDTSNFRNSLVHAERSLLSFKRNIFAGLGAIGIGFSTFQIGKTMIKNFQSQEQASKNLEDALALAGANYKKVLPEMEAFANAMQKETQYSDKDILNQMSFAIRLGVTTDRLKEVTKAAVGLSSITGRDLRISMLMLTRAANGNYIGLQRLGFAVDKTMTKQAAYADIIRRATLGYKLSLDDIKTQQGAYTRLGNAITEVSEQLVQLVTNMNIEQAQNKLADSLFKAADNLKKNRSANSFIIEGMKNDIVNIFETMKTSATTSSEYVVAVFVDMLKGIKAFGIDMYNIIADPFAIETLVQSAKTGFGILKDTASDYLTWWDKNSVNTFDSMANFFRDPSKGWTGSYTPLEGGLSASIDKNTKKNPGIGFQELTKHFTDPVRLGIYNEIQNQYMRDLGQAAKNYESNEIKNRESYLANNPSKETQKEVEKTNRILERGIKVQGWGFTEVNL